MILDKEKLPGLIKDLKSLIKQKPAMTIGDLKERGDDFSRGVIIRLMEAGYLAKDPAPFYKRHEDIPLLELLKELKKHINKEVDNDKKRG